MPTLITISKTRAHNFRFAIVCCLLLALPTVAQTPDDGLQQAIKALNAEIVSTKDEVKRLKQAQEQRQQRRAEVVRQQQRIKAKTPVAVIRAAQARHEAAELEKKSTATAVRIREQEALIQTNESRLAQLDVTVRPTASPAPAEPRKVIASLVNERNELREKIKRANRRWFCRYFHIGCIGRK